MKKILLIIVSIMLIGCTSMEKKYQSDMDIKRVRQVDYIANLLRDYYMIAGEYPLQDRIKDKNIRVFLTNKKVDKRMYEQAKEWGFEVIEFEEFQKDINRVFQKETIIPEEPQKVNTFAPNFYFYSITKDSVSVMGFLYSPTDFTIYDEGNNKYIKTLLNSPLGYESTEIYLSYNVKGRYIYLKQYDIRAKKEKELKERAELIEDKITKGEFIKDEYRLSGIRTRKEKIYKDKENGIVVGEYHLTVEEDNVQTVIKEVFGQILKQNIDTFYNKETKQIYITFEERDRSVSSNDFEGVYQEGKKTAMIWDVNKEGFEVVLTMKNVNNNFESLYDYISDETESPEFD